MDSFLSISGDIKRLILTINGFPIGRRLAGYSILLVGFLLLVSSVAFSILMVWALLSGLLDGSFPPYINPEDSQWDVR